MKNITVLLSFLFILQNAFCQSVAEDTKGNSSVLLPMGSISFNSVDSRLKVNYAAGFPSPEKFLAGTPAPTQNTHYLLSSWDSSLIEKKNNRVLFAFGGEGASSDGIAAIFKEGHITPESKLFGALGIKWYPSKINLFKKGREASQLTEDLADTAQIIRNRKGGIIRTISNINSLYKESISELLKTYRQNIQTGINAGNNVSGLIADTLILSRVSIAFNNLYKYRENDTRWPGYLSSIVTEYANNPTLLNRIVDDNNVAFNPSQEQAVLTRWLAQLNLAETHAAAISTNRNNIIENDIPNNISNKKINVLFTTFLSFQRNYREFVLLDQSQTKLADQYVDKSFSGGIVSLNFNAFINYCSIIGISFGIQETDNYDDLKSFKVESSTISVDSNRTDKTTKEITGKKGNYFTFRQYPIMIDYIYLLRTEKEVVSFNPYLRADILAKSSDVLKNKYRYGLGISFFKRKDAKFILDVYAELQNPPGPDDKRSWDKRISAGIIAKLNLIPLKFERMNPTL